MRRPDPSDHYGGPPVALYEKRGELWEGSEMSEQLNGKESGLSAVQALGVALSVQAETMVMGEAQDRAPSMLEHLRAMGFDVTPRLPAAVRSAYAALGSDQP